MEVKEETIHLKVDVLKEFGKTSGLHKKIETTFRYEITTILKKIKICKEVVTDFSTGKTVRASISEVGPFKHKITWHMLAWLVENIIKYCIPIHRVSKMISIANHSFSTGRICDYLEKAATLLLPVYLYMAETLAESSVLYGDDSRANVIETKNKIRNNEIGADSETLAPLVQAIDDVFPRASKIKSGKRFKKQISISTLIGKSDAKFPKSTIYFYRTHVGDLGDLITHLLSIRRPKNHKIKLVTDLLSANKPDDWVADRFLLTYFGCGAHARRPFYRHRERDEDLCYFMLRAFALLAKVETIVDTVGRNKDNILKYRKKYSFHIWKAIKNRANTVVEENSWYPGSNLNDACMYILNNFETLTKYVHHPEIAPTNNISERILRSDKMMAISSKFRVSEKGRAVVDILRTFTMTCSAAKVPVAKYLVYVFTHHYEASKNPELFTPYAYAQKLAQEDYLMAG